MKEISTIISLLIALSCLGQLKDADKQFKSGNYSEALTLYQQSASDFKSRNETTNYVSCNLKIANAYIALGAYKKGLKSVKETISFCNAESVDDASIKRKSLLLKGESLRGLGRNDLALEDFKSALTLFSTNEEHADLAECYDNLGITYWNNENNSLALQYHKQALDINERLFGPRSIEAANSHNNLGLVYAKDNFFNALLSYNKAKEIYIEKYGNNHPKVANVLTNLAFLDGGQDNYDKAIEGFKEVSAIYEQIYAKNHPNKAFMTLSIGKMYHEKELYDKALSHFEEALDAYKQLYGNNHPEVVNLYTLIGNSFLAKHDFLRSLKSYQQAIYANVRNQSYSSLYDLPELQDYVSGDALLTSLQLKARALEALHFNKTLKKRDVDAALSTIVLADQLVSEIRNTRVNEADKIALGKLSAELYEDAINLCDYLLGFEGGKKLYLEKAFYFFERSKSSVLLSAINETKAKSFAGIPDHLLQVEDSLRTELGYLEHRLLESINTEHEEATRRQLLMAGEAHKRFVKGLETNYPKYFELKYDVSLVSLQQIKASLNTRTAIISYFIGDNSKKIFVLYIDRRNARLFSMSKNPHLEKDIKGLRNAITFKANAITKQSKVLYNQLIPKKMISEKIDQLIIVPEGALTSIPFEVLTNSHDKETQEPNYMIKDYAIGYHNSVTLYYNKLSKETSLASDARGVLLMAPVEFPISHMATLPGTKQEVEDIRQLFRGKEMEATRLLRNMASEKTIKEIDFKKYDFVHFATHGLVNESEPGLSRVFLASGEQEDGSLYAGEIYNLSIGSRLVCLSACETGKGKIEKGEGLVGLSRALSYAGAENLIVSLWSVSDNSTTELMINFYKNYLLKGYPSFSTALRKAKLQLMKNDDYKEPYYWAPFILIGD